MKKLKLVSGMKKVTMRMRGSTEDTRLTSDEKAAIGAFWGFIATTGLVTGITVLLSF